MTQYQIAQPSDRADLLDFGNFVFSQAHRPHDFRKLLPKIYGDDTPSEVMAQCHYIAKQDGRIRALVACPTIRYHVGEESLTLGTVGTVSVHPYSRGEGHMRKLVHMMIDDMREKGADMLVLGGQRQRYNYYGFERVGRHITFLVSATNMRHAFGGAKPNGLRFDELTKDDPRLDKVFELYHAKPLHADRPRERFFDITRSWASSVYAVMRDQEMLGYLVSGDKESIGEIALVHEGDLPTVLGAWLALMDAQNVSINAAEYETGMMRILAQFAEGERIESEEMILPLNWANCLRAAFAEKAMFAPLADGEKVYCLDGQTVRVTVKNGKATVENAEGAQADVTLSGIEAVNAVYSTIGQYIYPDKWMPLPFNMSSQDKF